MSKIRDLPELGSLDDNDLVYAVDSTVGANGGRKITKQNLKESLKPTDAETKTAYENNADTNAFTDTEKSKLAGIEAGATADQDSDEVNYDNNASGLSATNVKAALDELAEEKENTFAKNTAFNKNFGGVVDTVVEGNDNRLSTTQQLIVKKNPGVGEFSSIKLAIDSISDASANKPYQVNIGPGIYIEDTISVPSFVHVRGRRSATIVQPSNPSNDIFSLNSNCSVGQLRVEGAIGTGAAAFRRVGGSTDSFLNLIEFGSNYYLVRVDSTAGAASVYVENCRIDSFSEFQSGFSVVGTGSGLLNISGLTGEISGAGVNCDSLVYGTGATNHIHASGINMRVVTPGTLQNVFLFEDGIHTHIIGSVITHAEVGLYIPNVGSGPDVQLANCSFLDTNGTALLIENPNTTGTLVVIADAESRSIDTTASETMSISITDTSSSQNALYLYGDLIQGLSESSLMNISKLNREEATLGLVSGGLLSSNPTPLELNVTAGNGFLMDSFGITKEIVWNTANVLIPANSVRYITVNENSVVQAESSLPVDLTERIILGRVTTSNAAFNTIEASNLTSKHHGNLVERYLREAFGAIFSTGSVTSENGSTDRSVDVTSGEYYFGTTRFTPTGGAGIAFTLMYRDGIGGFTQISSETVISNSVYDNNSGIPQSIPSGEFTKGVLLSSGDGVQERYFFVMGQATYAILNDAVAADLPQLPNSIAEAFTPIAAIIVQEGSSPISQIIDIRPRPAFAAFSSGSASDHGGLTGLTDDDHIQYLLTNGGRSMTGNLNMGSNNITNVGTVNSVNVAAHASRHLPGGADPLSTAAPLTNLSGNTSNSTGTANSLSRSDHTHAINNATTSIAGLLSATDKTKLDTVESGAKDDQSAAEVPYNNATSGLTASQVQAAIDEVEGRLETNETATQLHVNGGPGKHDASEIDYERIDGNKVSIQAASDDVESAITDLDDNKLARSGVQAMTGNLDMGTNNINNAGTINGVNIAAHASRHNPGGADPVSTAAPTSPLTATTVNGEGVASSLSRSDHAHAITTAAPATNLSATTTNAVGTASSLARSDHGHAISVGAPSTQIPAQSNTEGTSPNLARADHIHNIPIAAAVELTDSTNGAGSASSFSRSDHTHSHGNRGGGALHALVTTVVNGFMSAIDKVKLNRMDVGHLSYSNSASQATTSTSFVSVNLGTDRESFANSLFTKVNATDFRADFTGQVKVHFKVVLFPGANDRGAEVCIQRGATDLTWTEGRTSSKNDVNRLNTCSGSFILDCTNGDIFRLRFRSVEGDSITLQADDAFMAAEVYRIA